MSSSYTHPIFLEVILLMIVPIRVTPHYNPYCCGSIHKVCPAGCINEVSHNVPVQKVQCSWMLIAQCTDSNYFPHCRTGKLIDQQHPKYAFGICIMLIINFHIFMNYSRAYCWSQSLSYDSHLFIRNPRWQQWFIDLLTKLFINNAKYYH